MSIYSFYELQNVRNLLNQSQLTFVFEFPGRHGTVFGPRNNTIWEKNVIKSKNLCWWSWYGGVGAREPKDKRYSVVWVYITLYIPIFWTKFLKFSKTLYIPIHKDFETKTPENTKNFGLRRPETCFRLVCSSFYNLWMLWPQFQSILKLQTHKTSSFQKKNTLVWALYIPIQNQNFRKFSKTLYIPIVIYTHTTL